ncbi:hypothetical protein H4219_004383 [Mycoemilia scoparia]|uniref:SEC7 domain-containing protein n=1 Tax=Mycoemilia scoparia TaxID=417184 RepID=A0A9W8A1D9_9FUNG|nr:hypothetical protein H4219_004383 [Mycoemilia scoparia]
MTITRIRGPSMGKDGNSTSPDKPKTSHFITTPPPLPPPPPIQYYEERKKVAHSKSHGCLKSSFKNPYVTENARESNTKEEPQFCRLSLNLNLDMPRPIDTVPSEEMQIEEETTSGSKHSSPNLKAKIVKEEINSADFKQGELAKDEMGKKHEDPNTANLRMLIQAKSITRVDSILREAAGLNPYDGNIIDALVNIHNLETTHRSSRMRDGGLKSGLVRPVTMESSTYRTREYDNMRMSQLKRSDTTTNPVSKSFMTRPMTSSGDFRSSLQLRSDRRTKLLTMCEAIGTDGIISEGIPEEEEGDNSPNCFNNEVNSPEARTEFCEGAKEKRYASLNLGKRRNPPERPMTAISRSKIHNDIDMGTKRHTMNLYDTNKIRQYTDLIARESAIFQRQKAHEMQEIDSETMASKSNAQSSLKKDLFHRIANQNGSGLMRPATAAGNVITNSKEVKSLSLFNGSARRGTVSDFSSLLDIPIPTLDYSSLYTAVLSASPKGDRDVKSDKTERPSRPQDSVLFGVNGRNSIRPNPPHSPSESINNLEIFQKMLSKKGASKNLRQRTKDLSMYNGISEDIGDSTKRDSQRQRLRQSSGSMLTFNVGSRGSIINSDTRESTIDKTLKALTINEFSGKPRGALPIYDKANGSSPTQSEEHSFIGEDEDSNSQSKRIIKIKEHSESQHNTSLVGVVQKRKTPTNLKQHLEHVKSIIPTTDLGTVLAQQDEEHRELLREYMQGYHFENKPVDFALRELLTQLHLPKESQQIDRIIQMFSEHYQICNPDLFSSSDAVYSLAFQILLLHTDAHNPRIKHKMTKSQFVRSAKTVESCKDICDEILEIFYDNITHSKFEYANSPGHNHEDVTTQGSNKNRPAEPNSARNGNRLSFGFDLGPGTEKGDGAFAASLHQRSTSNSSYAGLENMRPTNTTNQQKKYGQDEKDHVGSGVSQWMKRVIGGLVGQTDTNYYSMDHISSLSEVPPKNQYTHIHPNDSNSSEILSLRGLKHSDNLPSIRHAKSAATIFSPLSTGRSMVSANTETETYQRFPDNANTPNTSPTAGRTATPTHGLEFEPIKMKGIKSHIRRRKSLAAGRPISGLVPQSQFNIPENLPKMPSTIKADTNLAYLRVDMQGSLSRKVDMSENGRRGLLRRWRDMWVVLSGSRLFLFKDSSSSVLPFSAISQRRSSKTLEQSFHNSLSYSDVPPTPASSGPTGQGVSGGRPQRSSLTTIIPMRGGVAVLDRSYTKHSHVFRVVAGDNRQILFRASDDDTVAEWMARVNYAATFKSMEIPPRVSSDENGYIFGSLDFDFSLDRNASTLPSKCSTDCTYVSRLSLLEARLCGLERHLAELEDALERDLRIHHQLTVLIPLKRSSRSRGLQAVQQTGNRLQKRYLDLQRFECYRDVLALDLLIEQELVEARNQTPSQSPLAIL